MTSQTQSLIKLKKSQIKPASQMLARAFHDDPVIKYAFSELGGDDPRVPYAYDFMLRLGMKYSYAYTTSPELEGVAVWMRIAAPYASVSRMLFSGAFIPAMKMGWKTGQRMMVFGSHLNKKHEEIINDLHYYLELIGVDPGHQGKGHASRLIRAMLERARSNPSQCCGGSPKSDKK